MKKIIMVVFTLSLFYSCASHNNHNNGYCGNHYSGGEMCHNHNDCGSCMFDRHCAYSLSQGDYNEMGSDQYMYEHEGKNYYFSSQKKMEKFKKDLDNNLNKANNNWDQRPRGRE